MTDADCYEILGTTFQISSVVPDIGAALQEMLAPFSCPPRRVPGRLQFRLAAGSGTDQAMPCLYRNDRPVVAAGGWPEILESLLAHINGEAIEGFAGFATHAGVVSLGGQAAAFPAGSGEGKSSLVAAALLAGFEYVSDEALCVEFATGALVRYPRPLGLSSWTCAALGLNPGQLLGGGAKSVMTPSALGGATASPPLFLVHIVKLRHHDLPEKPSLAAAPRLQGARWLLQQSFNHYKQPRASFDIAIALARVSRSWTLDYSDLPAASALLRDRLGSKLTDCQPLAVSAVNVARASLVPSRAHRLPMWVPTLRLPL